MTQSVQRTIGFRLWLALSSLSVLSTFGAVVIYASTSHITSKQVLDTAAVGAITTCVILVFNWILLNFFVSRPLRRYGALALRIADGEPVRMPADGRDELSSMASALNTMADALEHNATVDALTGLYNLRHLRSNLEVLLAQATATGTPVSLLVGDLDNLKPINDNYGHQTGDKILRAVGTALQDWTGSRNACWRVGGDEFVVALPGSDMTDAFVKANEIRNVIASIKVTAGDVIVSPAISVGISTYPDDGDTAGTLMGVADRRMYMSKSFRDEEKRLAHPAA